MNFTNSITKHITKLVGTLKSEDELQEILKRKFTKREYKTFIAFEEGKNIDEIKTLLKEEDEKEVEKIKTKNSSMEMRPTIKLAIFTTSHITKRPRKLSEPLKK